MRRPLIALTVLAAGGAAAQSSITVFGVVDATVSGYANKAETPLGIAVTTSSTVQNSGGYASSRLGFRGTEDLGGGAAASFWLEAGILNDSGSGLASGGGFAFNRRSTVSLSGILGEIRLGRDYTPTFWNDAVADPFTSNGVGINLIATASGFNTPGQAANGFQANPNYIRASNSVGYFLPPDLRGFYGQAMYAFNEATKYDPGVLTPNVPNSQRAGRYVGGRFGYTSGPLDVAVAAGRSTIGDQFFLGTTTNLDIWNVAATYDFGALKLFGEYSNNKLKTSFSGIPPVANAFGFTSPGANGALVGLTVPVGPGLIRAVFTQVKYNNVTVANQIAPGLSPDPKSEKFALGYVYNLSKRTALYATAARIDNKNGADLTVGGPAFFTRAINGSVPTPHSSTGYDLGIRHVF
ncbi:porin [Variovorax saccharolyticus]|uniref:porin n=1 Tax=Variovorax saccharolyticus TaxID=3053516 RepID=UPI0025770458|nr:porin [Variovorax sp. J31P216]MDM0026204.1 porin [Variovorax sp. J31P216]